MAMATQGAARTRQMPLLTLRAQFAPATLDTEKRTCQLTWTTGAAVLRGGGLFSDPFYEKLSLDRSAVRMGRLQSGTAPLLNAHNSYDINNVLGVVVDAQIDPGNASGSATVRFDSGVEGSNAMRMVGEGTLRNVSVGYFVYEMTRAADADDGTPVFVATDWEPYELSMVPIGADAGAVTRAAGTNTNLCVFIEERTMDPDDTTATTTNPPAGQPAIAPAPAPAPVPVADQVRVALAAEQARSLGILRVGQTLRRPDVEVNAAISSGMSLDAFRAASIDALASAPPEQGGTVQFKRRDPRITAGQDARDKFQRGATAWIIERSGLGQLFALAREEAKKPRYANQRWVKDLVQLELDPGEFRGTRMLDIARQSLELGGHNTRGLTQMQLVGEAFTRTSPTATTGDFPFLLENTMNKTLLAAYLIEPDTWMSFCTIGALQDFRPSNRYRPGTFGPLAPLNEVGEFANKTIPDAEKQQISAGTFGGIAGISRQTIVNDDMGAFSSIATGLGRSAKLTVENYVYTSVLGANGGLGPNMFDGRPLFDAAHGNISTPFALSANAIDADRVAMAVQKDPSKNELLSLRPAVLVLPVTLGGVARQINTAQYDFDAGLSSNKNPMIPNKVGGLFKEIVDTARVSGTRRYLFADPAVAPAIEVAFLDGQMQPFMDLQQGWRSDGVEWKVRLDFGANAIDWRPAVTNAGA